MIKYNKNIKEKDKEIESFKIKLQEVINKAEEGKNNLRTLHWNKINSTNQETAELLSKITILENKVRETERTKLEELEKQAKEFAVIVKGYENKAIRRKY